MPPRESVEALLERIAAGIERLRVDLADQRTGNDVRLELLLRAAHALLGSKPFNAAHLVDIATARLSTRYALRHAVDAITGSTKAKSKSLGKFLSAHAGAAASGLRLVRVRGTVYRIESTERRGEEPWGHQQTRPPCR